MPFCFSRRIQSRTARTTSGDRPSAGLVEDEQPGVGEQGAGHAEGSQRLDVLRGLHGLAHGLDQVRERVQVVTDEPDHGVVVVRVERVRGPEALSRSPTLPLPPLQRARIAL